MVSAFSLLTFLVFPSLLIYLCNKSEVLKKIGPVILAFVTGILGAVLLQFIPLNHNLKELEAVQTTISEISIVVALPLILFSINIKQSLQTTPKTLLSMGLAMGSVIIMALIGVIIFKDDITNVGTVAGMATGAYTGGGPNMGAIKTAIGAPNDLFLTMVAYDILFSALYLLFLITVGKRIFTLFLPAYKPTGKFGEQNKTSLADDSSSIYPAILNKRTIVKTFLALILSFLIVGASLGLSELFHEDLKTLVVIISITTLAIVASFIPFVRSLPNSFALGMYFILIFCFTTGSMTNLSIFSSINGYLAGFFILIIFGSMLLQSILSKLFKINVDTFLMTSSASILSVPFVPITSATIKNKEILFSGFSAAIIGYLLANYLGIIVHYLSSIFS